MKTKAFIILIGLLLIGSQITYAGPNPGIPVDSHLSGPAIVGSLIITPDSDGSLIANFSGKCKGVSFEISNAHWPTLIRFDLITEQDLQDYVVGNGASAMPAGCAKEGLDLIINTINKFSNSGVLIQAEVVLMQLVNK